MSDTPRTNAMESHGCVRVEFARTLERELAQAQAECDKLRTALREASPYVPDHHGPVRYLVDSALYETKRDE